MLQLNKSYYRAQYRKKKLVKEKTGIIDVYGDNSFA